MMKTKLTLLTVLLAAGAAPAATYEMRRITVAGNATAEKSVLRCHLLPGKTVHISEVGGIESKQAVALQTDEKAVQALVDQAQGLPRPDFDGADSFTNWWVRSSPTSEFKLIRSNVHNAQGTKHYQASGAAETLATFLGGNCFRVFGQ